VFILNVYQGKKLKITGVPLEGEVTVGRERNNRIVLPAGSVSRHHATFLLGKDGVLLRDEGSTNGCEVNGAKVRGSTVRVQPEDHIKIGTFRIEVAEKVPWSLPAKEDRSDQTIIYEGPPLARETLPIDRLRALYDFASRGTRLDTDALLTLAAKKISTCLQFDVLCVITKLDNGGTRAQTWNHDGPCSLSSVTLSRALIDRCLQEEVAILADAKDTKESSSADLSRSRGKPMNSALCVPLMSGDHSLGALYVDSKSTSVIFGKDDLQFLILVANAIASNLSLKKVLHDIKVEAEKLEAILESLKEGVLITDREFCILATNSTAVTIFGKGNLVGMRLQDALAGRRHTFHSQAVPGRSCFQLETTPDGEGKKGQSRFVYEASVSENRGGDKEGWQYVICLHDVTQAQRLERMKAMLVNRLAHKLRTPLTVITGVNALIAEHAGKSLDPELMNLLRQSIKHSEECAALIDRFVEYTFLNLREGATLDLYGRCPLEDLVEYAVEANAETLQARSFSVIRKFPAVTFAVQGDEAKLRLVFGHLVQNAVKFGKAGGHLEIDAQEVEGAVRIRFLDDGPGIPPRELEHVFQLLHQVDVENTGEVPGAGLGLWFARDIVQAHGGHIQITSPADREGGGTLVEVALPAAASPEQAPPETAREKSRIGTVRLLNLPVEDEA
jgi:signal transduction histidine kinase